MDLTRHQQPPWTLWEADGTKCVGTEEKKKSKNSPQTSGAGAPGVLRNREFRNGRIMRKLRQEAEEGEESKH